MVRGRQWALGDVFTIPVDDARQGVGQIVGTYGKDAYYFAVYDCVAPERNSVDVNEALRARVLFLALSVDAKLAAGHWTVIDHREVPDVIRLPAYKEAVGGPGRVDVVDYSGKQRRLASESEAELLPNRKVVAPVRLERALRAKHGLEPWVEAYSELAPEESMTTERLFR
jgi:hypothetical protein